MNKYFLYAASVLALASCSSDDFLGENSGNGQNAANSVINFGGETGKITRAGDAKEGAAAELLGKNFVLVGFKGSATAAANTTYAFDHYNVNYVDGTANTTESNTANWEYVNQSMKVKGADEKKNDGSLAQSGAKQQTIKYWDHSCASYDFIAFSMGKGNAADGKTTYATPTSVNKDNLAEAAYTLTGDANTLSECYISDMKTVKEADYSKKAVAMSFRHLTSKVRIALYETVPGYVISDVKFYGVATDGTSTDQGTLFGKFNNNGTLTVYFPTSGTKNDQNADYNKAHVKFASTEADATVPSKEFGKVNYNNQAEDQIAANKGFLSQSSTDPSYCGATAKEYLKVLPAEGESQPATLRIDYKLTATDGTGETINVTGATATVPAKYTEWKPGYAYTYIFKISQNTNGSTGGSSTGLTAISFDAVVVDDEANGLQQTITTDSDPSITTYGFKDGKVTTDGDEYKSETDIYATVHVPATETKAATTAAPQNLYTVTIEDGAAQTINEASVANALVNGTKDPAANPTTWTVTDANGKKMIVTKATDATKVTKVPTEDGHDLDVNALKWTGKVTDPATETFYAVEYVNGTNKSYKIVKVVK
ncbi:hypothetical protein [uncultured Prevotella sp.]|uniref:hypothetical protein n=1 Tax=uncultured Prevotella sp. TaxID=159272 RepID=UPI0027E264FE|nr:hypothetical protein [uncultured Prevotella sp.]